MEKWFLLVNVRRRYGVNDRVALSKAEIYMRNRINEEAYVGLLNRPRSNLYQIDCPNQLDTVIEPGVMLKGKTVIGSNCFIGAHGVVRDGVLEDGVRLSSRH